MSIQTRAAVQAAFDRAMKLDSDRDAAVAATAQALGLTAEAVEEAIEPEEATQ